MRDKELFYCIDSDAINEVKLFALNFCGEAITDEEAKFILREFMLEIEKDAIHGDQCVEVPVGIFGKKK